MKVLETLVLLMMIAALGFGVYTLWINLPGESKPFKPYSANSSNSFIAAENVYASDKIAQFYPNMRFKERNISYRLESTCTETKWKNIERAFSILSGRTVLSFYSTRDEPEIKVLCSEVSLEAKEKGHFIAGEGGPSEIINTSDFAVILNGRISLYRDEVCDEPKIAIHEILHALGFDHYNNTESILYPVTGCNQQIDQEIIDDIDRLYSFDTLPDLVIDSISAEKIGRYLNFGINVSNEGLADSKGAELYLYVNDEKIANFTLGDLDIGMKKMLSVQNTRVPSNSDRVLFVVESADRGELTFENNRAEISIL